MPQQWAREYWHLRPGPGVPLRWMALLVLATLPITQAARGAEHNDTRSPHCL